MKAIYNFAVRTFVTSPQFRIYKSTISFKKSKGSLFPRLLTPYELDMADDTKGKNQLGQAVVRLQKAEEGTVEDHKVSFSLQVKNPENGVMKQVNMCRNAQENMDDFLQRFKATLAKVVVKKKGKKQKTIPQEPEGALSSLEIKFYKQGSELKPGGKKAQDFLFQEDVLMQLTAPLDCSYQIIRNPAMLTRGKLSNHILSGYPFYPSRLEYENANERLTKFEWFVSESAFIPSMADEKNDSKKTRLEPCLETLKWTKRSDGFIFTPDDTDIHRYLKVVCKPCSLDGKEGLPYQLISADPISEGPKNCPFESRHGFHPPSTKSSSAFRILTYNILADLYADSDFSRTVLFAQCPDYAMEISYRKLLLLKELSGYQADIMCLQEVDEKVFEHDLKPILGHNGHYEGVFSRKAGQVSEGLACFWNTEKFRLIETERHVIFDTLDQFPNIHQAVEANSKLKESLSKRTTVLKIIVLETAENLEPRRRIILGITHLYFKPDADHIRLIQTGVAMEHLLRKLKEVQSQCAESTLILAGDFNSTPPFGVPEFVTKGVVKEDYADWKSCVGEEVEGLTLSHPLSMSSACGTPEFTTYTLGFKDCIDWIFYQNDLLRVTGVVPFPLKEDLEARQGLPHIDFPSDHIACVADMEWIEAGGGAHESN